MRLWIVAIAAFVLAGPGAVQAQDITPRPSEAAKALTAAHDKMMRAMEGPGVAYSGDPDLDFVTQMIPHHQGAVDMAKLELEYGITPNPRILARAIIASQEAEIAEMTRWMAGHTPEPTADAAAVRAGYEASNQKMMAGMGEHGHTTQPDLTFLTMMVPHHQGAIDMAEVQLKYGRDPQIRALAERIMAAQRVEIIDMKLMIQDNHEH